MTINPTAFFARTCMLLLFLGWSQYTVGQCYDLRVAIDGSGDFTSVQEAIDAVPDDLSSPFVIYVAKGIYDEKLFIEKNFITLVGESRDSTIITTAVLRRVWRENNPSDWGAATVNISNDATDLTFAHMTIRNNFADVFPDFPDNNDHTFAIRGGGHRVIIIDCNVVTTGGDTLSLWNTDGGMFYHNACFFEGYVDYVAPRGYCYITDCEFYGYNKNASIWHDGRGGEDHKLVVRDSWFDGVPGFALGRYHADAQFYLIGCEFSENMANKPIEHVTNDPLQWGERVYYNDCHTPFFDWPWMWNNLEEAAGSPQPDEIDPLWTFKGEWDPESLIDGLLPHAFLPSPANEEGCISENAVLTWVPGICVEAHLVYFGTTADSLEFVARVDTNLYTPDHLDQSSTYFWRVDEVTASDTIPGETWIFRTREPGDFPSPVFDPTPEDQGAYESNVIRLDWKEAGCGIDSFYVYFGSGPENLEYQRAVKHPPYFHQGGMDNTRYYWRVDSKSEIGTTRGTTWNFIFNPTTSTKEQKKDGFEMLVAMPNPFTNGVQIALQLPTPGNVRIWAVDLNGKIVGKSLETELPEGESTISFGGFHDQPDGVYYLLAEHQGTIDTFKVVKQ